jgi:hypothetical protein
LNPARSLWIGFVAARIVSSALLPAFSKVSPIFSTLDLKVPEKGIAYDEKYVLKLYLKNRLSIKSIKYGSWREISALSS